MKVEEGRIEEVDHSTGMGVVSYNTQRAQVHLGYYVSGWPVTPPAVGMKVDVRLDEEGRVLSIRRFDGT